MASRFCTDFSHKLQVICRQTVPIPTVDASNWSNQLQAIATDHLQERLQMILLDVLYVSDTDLWYFIWLFLQEIHPSFVDFHPKSSIMPELLEFLFSINASDLSFV